MRYDVENIPKWQTANPNFYHISKQLWKFLRANETKAEKALWHELRNKILGYKFRRQHIIDVFIVDFVCILKKLVIEVDGKNHLCTKEYDDARTEFLNSEGFEVIRFTNEEVLNSMHIVLEAVRNRLNYV